MEKVYAAEGRHATPVEIVAQALGYKSATNGSAAQAIASLRYYGLMERPKDGFLAVSKDYETYKFSPDEAQKQALLVGWLRTPPVFSTLLDKYAARLPSDANIRFDFINMGFIPGGADAYVGVFRRSVEFARFYDRTPAQAESEQQMLPSERPITAENESGFESQRVNGSQSPPAQPVLATAQLAPATAQISGHVAQPDAAKSDVIRVPVRLPKGRCAWLELPIPFYESDKERLKAYIDMQLADDADDE
ncbi:hypothetical protein [Ralstonia mannitolilytica]|uniref:hypothetical protein n=1 Tax=Ralstonia mannitolilytica TaxID=105219 RepID=UPI000CEE6395|nr:hypothetical protein [Ralstonia mannitolilytica]